MIVPTGAASKRFAGMGTMNRTGAFLWGLLEQERSLGELSELFAGEYGLTEEQSLQDVAEFLEAAQSHDAVLPC
ncbi:MAG: PqqD family protein [Clostridiales bacterium]|nr:PqqD family protein [Clostridiales bacterium]